MRGTSVSILVISIIMLASTLINSDWSALWPIATTTPQAYVAASTPPVHRLTLALHGQVVGSLVSIVHNGKPVATFGNGSVTLHVSEGDFIEIDSASPKKVTVRVQETSAEILMPRAGDLVSVQNTVEALGRIYFRRRSG